MQQGADVMDEQRIENLSNLFRIRKLKGALEGDPVEVNIAKAQTAPTTYQTPLKCIGAILTTWLVFSLFKMPSLRPRVMPATFNSFVPLMKWLSSLLATQIPFTST
jgi:hypothetical protein